MSPSLHRHAVAHGKVILFGEHAVVYGIEAVACGLPDGVSLTATEAEHRLQPMTLSIPAWDIDLELTAENEHPVAQAALAVLTHCDGPITGWHIHGTSTLPARAGLGSSAALAVAIARLVLGPTADVADVVAASLAGERVFHGEPSGIDSQIAAPGGVLRFVRGEPVEPLADLAPFHLAVLPSGIPRSTAAVVADVRSRLGRIGSAGSAILSAIRETTVAGISALKSNDLQALGELFDVNHELVSALGASSQRLDQLCSLARSNGAYGAKLTGAGRGGCVIALTTSSPAGLLAVCQRDHVPAFSVEISCP